MEPSLTLTRSDQRNAVLTGFFGWTFDAFDFFILTFVLGPVAKEFGRTIPDIARTLTVSLTMRPVRVVLFGMLADRYGRRGAF
jgi:SHS family lactate transporter-like MFS transporter